MRSPGGNPGERRQRQKVTADIPSSRLSWAAITRSNRVSCSPGNPSTLTVSGFLPSNNPIFLNDHEISGSSNTSEVGRTKIYSGLQVPNSVAIGRSDKNNWFSYVGTRSRLPTRFIPLSVSLNSTLLAYRETFGPDDRAAWPLCDLRQPSPSSADTAYAPR